MTDDNKALDLTEANLEKVLMDMMSLGVKATEKLALKPTKLWVDGVEYNLTLPKEPPEESY